MSSSPDRPAPSTVIAVGGLPGLTRAAATQTSTRSVLSGTMRSQSSRPMVTIALPCAGAEHALRDTVQRARAGRRAARARDRRGGPTSAGPGRRASPASARRATEKIRAAPAAAAAASPSKVSAALMSRVALASAASMAAVRSARVLAR